MIISEIKAFLALPYRRVSFLIITVSLTVLVPYLFPVEKSVSLSYVTHFNNKIAVLFFVFASVAYAYLTDAKAGEPEKASRNRKLSFVTLIASMLLTLLLAWSQLFNTVIHTTAFEALYTLDRIQRLVAGSHPYKDFEYAYGPLQLYVPLWLSKITHRSAYAAYYEWWAFQSVAGTAMLWYIVQNLPFSLPWRELLFWGMWFSIVPAMGNEGISYTTTRFFGGAFLLTALHVVWKKWGSGWITTIVASIAVLLALGVSPEQCVGVTSGLVLWFWLLFYGYRSRASLAMSIAFTGICFVILLCAYNYHYFDATLQFGSGAYAFPLTISMYVMLILITYTASICAAFQQLRRKVVDSLIMPMILGGLAVLPAAFGRSDLGHMQLATPALLIGIGYIQSHIQPRRYWSFAYALLFLFPGAIAYVKASALTVRQAIHEDARHKRKISEQLALVSPKIVDSSKTQSAAQLQSNIQLVQPCPVVYRVVDITPQPNHTAAEECMRTGFYFGLENVFTQTSIDRVIQDLREDPRRPLLLKDVPLDRMFPVGENDPASLAWLQGALYIPKAVNHPMDLQEIAAYVRSHYEPERASNGLSVWRPKPR